MTPALNPLAAACDAKGWLSPEPGQIEALVSGQLNPAPLRICSGGTTSRCAEDHHWTLDLSAGFRSLRWTKDHSHIRFGSGWTMGALQDQLVRQGRMIPTGLSGLPGAGFLLTGGMGPLSRSLGLAIDHLQAMDGVWGNGSRFSLTRPANHTPVDSSSQHEWRALLGAGLFVGVVCSFEMATLPLQPIQVLQACLPAGHLTALIERAETFPLGLTLQWCMGDQLEVLLVASGNDPEAIHTLQLLEHDLPWSQSSVDGVAGLHQLPRFGALSQPQHRETSLHQEVVGLLAPAWGSSRPAVVEALLHAMATRPHPACSIASQQLGGAVALQLSESTSFVHRQAEWKPWITASWPAGDQSARRKSLAWMETTWNHLAPHCQGIHLAQLHDHLPWHGRELEEAFGDWLPQLRRLKQRLDPAGILPSL